MIAHSSWKLLIFIPLLFLLCACATMTAPGYSSKYELLDSIRMNTSSFEKLGVDEVRPTDPKVNLNNITLRGSSLISPYGTYSKYIETALKTDLAELGALDQNSLTRIDVELIRNDIDISGIDKGKGVLEIKLKVFKEKRIQFEKVYLAETLFESYFMAAQALPAGQSEYGRLVQELMAKIFSDKDFISMLRGQK